MVKKEFLACGSSATIKQVCLPVWEAAFLMFVSGVLVGESALLPTLYQPTQSHPSAKRAQQGLTSVLVREQKRAFLTSWARANLELSTNFTS